LAVYCAPKFLLSDCGIMPKAMPSLFNYTSYQLRIYKSCYWPLI